MIRIKSNSRSGETKVITGTAAAEQFEGAYGNDVFRGMGGSDIFRGGYAPTTVDYSWARSAIKVNLSNDMPQQTGGGGLNRLVAIQGIIGTAYDDDIWGHNRADTLRGEGGNDKINGSLGNDLLDGGPGNDTLGGGDGSDRIHGGAGNDTIEGGWDNDSLHGDAGDDRITDMSGVDLIDGGPGNDVIAAGANDDKIYGGLDNDRMDGGPGQDLLDGGDGFDWSLFTSATRAVTVDRRDLSGASNSNDAYKDQFVRIEGYELSAFDDVFIGHGETVTVMGGAGKDRITGGGGRDTLYGGPGNDVLDGGRENDVLYGEDGDDILDGGYEASDALSGGKGNDTFRFSPGSSQSRYPDQILDFQRGDRIDLSAMDPKPGGVDDKLVFTSSGAITAAGQVTFTRVDADTFRVFADTNGDKIADFFLLVHTTVLLTQADFVL